jgi:hypothetical protein
MCPPLATCITTPRKETSTTPIHEQLDTLAGLVKAGKVRAIGLSNETPYGVHEFVRLAEQHGLPRVATTQNPYCLINRTFENGLDETCHRLNVSLLAYSPLGFGLLTGKYDASGTEGPQAPHGARISSYETCAQTALGQARSPGGGTPLQRLGARARLDASANGLGVLLHQMASGKHHHRCDLRWRSSMLTSTPGAPPCHRNSWQRSMPFVGSCATPRFESQHALGFTHHFLAHLVVGT